MDGYREEVEGGNQSMETIDDGWIDELETKGHQCRE